MRNGRNTVEFSGRTYTLDRHGFLDPPEQWDDNFARGMGRLVGIDFLTAEHWALIRYLRRKFIEDKTIPLVVQACADNRLRLSRLRYLFPAGYHRGACRVAGINYAFMSRANIWLTSESYATLTSEYKLSPDGFLEDPHQWNERFSEIVASAWRLPAGLTDKHWQVIHYLRDFYDRNGNIPTVYETCKAHDLDLAGLHRLFPDGYRRGACRIAGLPFFG